MAVGRISGPLLKSNLIRNGIDLAFDTDLLYLDVNNNRIGINNANPQYSLDVVGTTRTTDLLVSNGMEIADINISGNTISSDLAEIYLGTFDNVILQKTALIDDLKFEFNTISTTVSNANLELQANGTGSIEVLSDLNVTGNIHATGNITADGDIILGDANTDTITFNAEIASDIIPDQTNQYTLGTPGATWLDIYVDNFSANAVTANGIAVGGVDLTLVQGSIWYVAENGDDLQQGDHPQDPFGTIAYALTNAQSGDTIHIFPGQYVETFPLTIPTGVTIKGHSLRGVTIIPTLASNTNDAFLLNGETTIEDITIKDFYFDAVNNTGYAFRFANNASITTRSPYIRNVSVITEGSVTSSADPRGFDQGDAGKGVYADGSAIAPGSNEASMLFHSVTFITPGVDALTATNGVRIEWLNCFTYFSDRSIYALDGTNGKYNDGKTKLRVDGLIGTFSATETISYYDTDGITVLATGTIESVVNNKIFIDSKISGFVEPVTRISKIVIPTGDAQISTSQFQFGASSAKFDGTGDSLTLNSSEDFGFGTGDFTIDFWVYANNVTGLKSILDFRAGSTNDNGLYIYLDADTLKVLLNGSVVLTASAVLNASTWTQINLWRNGSTLTMYVAGSNGSSATVADDLGTTKPLIIGANFDSSTDFFDGFLDEIRIIKNAVEYNGAPGLITNELPVTLETVLLLRFEGNDTSTVFVDDNEIAQDIRFSGGATATSFSLVDYRDFGAEIRLIGSASIYGNYGLYGDGPGILMYAIGHNTAYIGAGKDSSNDPLSALQGNEVIELNSARIRFSTVDHKGDFRVGNLFHVDQAAGTVNFSAEALNLDLTQGLTFTDGPNTSFVGGSSIEVGNLKLSGNTLESTSGNLILDSYTNLIVLQDTTNVQSDVNITGDLTVNGNINLSQSSITNFTLQIDLSSNILPSLTDTYNLGSVSARWRNLYINEIDIDDININNNVIQTTISNSNLELQANGTGKVYVPYNDVVIDNDLTVYGHTNLKNTTIDGNLNLTGNINQTGNAYFGNVVVNGLVVNTDAQFDNIKISQNTITTTDSNSNLEISAAGTGIILIPTNNVQIDNDLNVIGNLTATTITTNSTVTTNVFQTADIKIENNVITTTQNTNLLLRTNGSNNIVIDNLSFINNSITSSTSLNIDATDYIEFVATSGLILPNGTTAERDINLGNGQIRYNNSLTRFEGYDGTNWFNLSGVEDLDGDTKITAELAPGTNDNIFRFYIQNSIVATLDATVFSVNELQVDDINFDNNVISTSSVNADFNFSAHGTGKVIFENFGFNQNTLTNISQDAVTEFVNLGTGYVRFNGTYGIGLPAGNSSTRNPAEIGMIRFNTDDQRVELYDGNTWLGLDGINGGVNLSQTQNIAIGFALIAG